MCHWPLRAPTPLQSIFWPINYRPHLSHCLVNVIFTIPTKSLSIYASTLSMWFQAAACNAVNASLLLNLINNNFLIFLTKILPILSLTYPQNPKICDPILVTLLKMQPHYSQSSCENATPSSSTCPLPSCKGVPTSPLSQCHVVI